MMRVFALCFAVCALLLFSYLLGNIHGYQAGRKEAAMERVRTENDSFLRTPSSTPRRGSGKPFRNDEWMPNSPLQRKGESR